MADEILAVGRPLCPPDPERAIAEMNWRGHDPGFRPLGGAGGGEAERGRHQHEIALGEFNLIPSVRLKPDRALQHQGIEHLAGLFPANAPRTGTGDPFGIGRARLQE